MASTTLTGKPTGHHSLRLVGSSFTPDKYQVNPPAPQTFTAWENGRRVFFDYRGRYISRAELHAQKLAARKVPTEAPSLSVSGFPRISEIIESRKILFLEGRLTMYKGTPGAGPEAIIHS